MTKDYTRDMAALRSWQLRQLGGNGLQQEKLRRYLALAMEELTEHQREVFLLHYRCGMSVTRTADFLGCNKSSVSRTLQRIRRRINYALRYAL